MQSSMFEAAPLPNSMAQQSRPQDHILHMLMESQGGADQIAQINTPVIKERPTGVEPHMVQTNKAGPRGDADMGAYEGHMEGGVRQGSGQCVYKNGNKYEGDWQNNLRHGRGTMHYASSASYDGEWQEGERSGHGVMKYKDGGTYEGQWLRDLKHGYGCFKFASHANYTGQWFEGKMHGQGTYTFADGQKFHGEFDRNLKCAPPAHALRCLSPLLPAPARATSVSPLRPGVFEAVRARPKPPTFACSMHAALTAVSRAGRAGTGLGRMSTQTATSGMEYG